MPLYPERPRWQSIKGCGLSLRNIWSSQWPYVLGTIIILILLLMRNRAHSTLYLKLKNKGAMDYHFSALRRRDLYLHKERQVAKDDDQEWAPCNRAKTFLTTKRVLEARQMHRKYKECTLPMHRHLERLGNTRLVILYTINFSLSNKAQSFLCSRTVSLLVIFIL